jgi:AcrR family transcriptional regulator
MGVRELSLRAVARRAGVSHSASYRHFSSKESLLAAIAEHGFILLAEGMRSAMAAQPGDELVKLQAAGTGYVRFALQYPHHLQIMFGGAIARFEDYPALIAAANHAHQQLTDIVNEGLKSGAYRTANGQLVQVAAWALVHGLAVLLAGGKIRTPTGADLSPAEQAAIASGVTKLFCEGLAP